MFGRMCPLAGSCDQCVKGNNKLDKRSLGRTEYRWKYNISRDTKEIGMCPDGAQRHFSRIVRNYLAENYFRTGHSTVSIEQSFL
jgi:hypothetical protein